MDNQPESILLQTQIKFFYANGRTTDEVKTSLGVNQEMLDHYLISFFKNVQSVLLRGHIHLDGEQNNSDISAKPKKQQRPLSKREKELIILIGEGIPTEIIADKHMFISEQTVKNHLYSIFDKVGVESRLELAVVTDNAGERLRKPRSLAPGLTAEIMEEHVNGLSPLLKRLGFCLCNMSKDQKIASDFTLRVERLLLILPLFFARMGVVDREEFKETYGSFFMGRRQSLARDIKKGLEADGLHL